MSGFGRRLQQGVKYQLPGGGGGGTVTHGYQITPDNTGYAAYFDNELGRTLRQSDLTVYTAAKSASDFGANPTITKAWFQGGFNADTTFTAVGCYFENPVWNYRSNFLPMTLNWCTIVSPTQTVDSFYGVGDSNYTIYRCQIAGFSDGLRINGGDQGIVATECYIRLAGASTEDHNDGAQAYGGSGSVTIERCNIDGNPTNNVGGANSALFMADNTTGTMFAYDNLLLGGGYTIRVDDAAWTAEGNWVVEDSYAYGPTTFFGGDGTDPGGTITDWGSERPNYLVSDNGDGTYTQVSVLAAPS